LSPSFIDRIESVPRRELYFFGLYRVLEAGIMAALVFSPVASVVGEARNAVLGGTVALLYLVAAAALLVAGRNERWLVPLVFGGACIDIVAATLFTHAMPSVAAGIAMMLLFNVAAAAMLLPLRFGLTVAVLASLALGLEHLWSTLETGEPPRSAAELSMFITSYLALAWLANQIGQRARSSQQLAEKRTAEVANLVEINELIIRRMRTGVLVVDADNRITLANEAASLLLGDGAEAGLGGGLNQMAPDLARRLQRWRGGWQVDDTPLQLFPDQPEVQPRFARLLADSDLALVFLDDTTVVSRRAESLTLAALGRFSASLAHEIRNPLAAINYAVQLLEESRNVDDADRRLLQIIHQQCLRTNGIVESVLGLARRERANPENLDLGAFVRRFVEDYRQTLSIETDSLEAIIPSQPVQAMVDPRHLQQILTALVHNALKYGRMMDEPSRVRLRVFQDGRNAAVDVLDRGPGIPEGVVAQLFRPFFTTSEHGTGLGLYIARELSRANQAQLEYVPVPGGGACFRVVMTGPHNIMPA
jgi:two-component system sensor histidine kinase PilS (NtrC family)